MNTRKNMMNDRVPRKYLLLWNPLRNSISVQVHKECVLSARPVQPTSPWVQGVAEAHAVDIAQFEGSLQADTFGFNKLIRKSDQRGDYTEFEVALPRIRIETSDTCDRCDGSGKRTPPFADDDCIFCRGTGKKVQHNWKDAYLITSCLNLMLNNVVEMCGDTSAPETQLMTVVVHGQPGRDGSSIGGILGVDVTNLIRSQASMIDQMMLPGVRDAMLTAHDYMMTNTSLERGLICPNLRDGHLALDCGGDACGINVPSPTRQGDCGSKFSGHSVDNPAQALTLLVGLASLTAQLEIYVPKHEEVVARV